MCHYDHATVPVPAVNVVTLFAPTVFVVAVNPAPTANTFVFIILFVKNKIFTNKFQFYILNNLTCFSDESFN